MTDTQAKTLPQLRQGFYVGWIATKIEGVCHSKIAAVILQQFLCDSALTAADTGHPA